MIDVFEKLFREARKGMLDQALRHCSPNVDAFDAQTDRMWEKAVAGFNSQREEAKRVAMLSAPSEVKR